MTILDALKALLRPAPPWVIVVPHEPRMVRRRPQQRSALPAELGHELRAARRRAGLTLQELAARTGRSWSLLSRLERGGRSPSCRTVLRIAAALNVSDDLERRLLEHAAPSNQPIHALLVIPALLRWPRVPRRWRNRQNRVLWRLWRPLDVARLRFLAYLRKPGRWLPGLRGQGDSDHR